MFPVIPDKGSQLSQTREPRFVTYCDAPEHLPNKDNLLDPWLLKTMVTQTKLSHTFSQEAASMVFLVVRVLLTGAKARLRESGTDCPDPFKSA